MLLLSGGISRTGQLKNQTDVQSLLAYADAAESTMPQIPYFANHLSLYQAREFSRPATTMFSEQFDMKMRDHSLNDVLIMCYIIRGKVEISMPTGGCPCPMVYNIA